MDNNNRNESEMNELAEILFPDDDSGGFESREQVMISIPGAILHLIDKEHSIELTTGDFSIVELKQGDNVVAALARVIGHDMIQWPLAKDESVVKLDDSHYFFTFPSPNESRILNYGLTLASKGQEEKLKVLDSVLDQFSSFRVENITMPQQGWLGVDVSTISPGEMEKEEVEISTSAYWTTIAPNVDDYSSTIARLIAAGSGQLIRGILWCGDVTVDRLKWGNDLLNNKRRDSEVTPPHPHALMMMQSVKQMTMMSEQVATGILSGVVKVSGFFTSTVANSKVAQKFFSLLPGEIVLASLDGFNKVWDAVEVAGKNVMSTTSVVTTGLVSQRYGEDAGKVTHEGFSAAEHALGTAWAVLKIGKSLNPKSVIKPNTLAKATAQANAVRLQAAQSNE